MTGKREYTADINMWTMYVDELIVSNYIAVTTDCLAMWAFVSCV